jgi:BMFP domain-containing protein YqiC
VSARDAKQDTVDHLKHRIAELEARLQQPISQALP